jgi:signal transduction histidine kinase
MACSAFASTVTLMDTSGFESHRAESGNGALIGGKHIPGIHAELLAIQADLRRQAELVSVNEDLRRQISALQQKIERLVAADDSKDRFLAMVSHELRTPLASMLPWTHALRTGLLGTEHTEHALEVIERNTRLQARLIDDLLDVSRMIAGTVRLERAPIDLAPILEVAVHSVRPQADAKGVTLELLADAEVGTIVADRVRIEQIMMNLTANALHFTPRGGRITVRLTAGASGAEISVADTGAGIDPVFLPYVFDAFRQGDEPNRDGQGGLGLGLAIVRHLVELHGGIARAESPGNGCGSTFTLSLPFAV